MSPHAIRIEFLRKQQADLQYWVDHWSLSPKFHVRKKRTIDNLKIVTDILRDLAARLIAGGSLS